MFNNKFINTIKEEDNMKNKKVLVLNQGSTENYGDIAINETIITYLKSKGFQVDYCAFWLEELVFGKNDNQTNKFIVRLAWHFNIIRDMLMKRFIKKDIDISSYDSVIIGGGELLGKHLGFNTAIYVWTNILFKHNIPIYILGVSGNKDMSWRLLRRNKKSLHRCSRILVRDSYTYKICKETYKVDSEQKPDVVFAFRNICRQLENNEEIYAKDSLVCVPIIYEALKDKMNFQNKEQYFQYLNKLISNKIKLNNKLIITTTVRDDDSLAEEFYLWLKRQNTQYDISLKKYSNINDYINILKHSHTVISARMHALILAILYDCKISVIPFKEKLQVFEKEYSHNINIEEVEKNALESLDIINKELEKQDG